MHALILSFFLHTKSIQFTVLNRDSKTTTIQIIELINVSSTKRNPSEILFQSFVRFNNKKS